MFPMLYPYMEQTANYNMYCSTKDREGRTGVQKYVIGDLFTFWVNDPTHPDRPGLGEAGRRGISSIPNFLCPSRRKGMAMSDPQPPNDNGIFPGPLTDYAIPVEIDLSVPGAHISHWASWISLGEREYTAVRTPIHRSVGKLPYNSMTPWAPRGGFELWKDGTSNQFVLGEKHFSTVRPPGVLIDEHGDAGYQGTWNWYAHNISRTFAGYGFARGPKDNHWDTRTLFGSAHTSVVNFLFGDGSVQAISNTADPQILYRLTNPIDGESVTIP